VRCQRRPLALSNLAGVLVDGLYFDRQRALRDFTAQHRAGLHESDVKPVDRFLMERFITAPLKIAAGLQQGDGHLQGIDTPLAPGEWQPSPRLLSLDIETDGIGGEVISVALSGDRFERVLMQGVAGGDTGDTAIKWQADESALLRALLADVRAVDPDLLIGWNLVNFDLDYLARRCRHHNIPFQLGRGGARAEILQPRQPGQGRIASIPGRVALDGIDMLRAAFWSFESFALDAVARELIGEGKLIDEHQDRVAEIRRLYREDRPALAAYNLQDCRLVEAIFDRTGLIDFALQRATLTGLALGRQGGSVAAFDNLYLPRLHRAGFVADDTGAHQFDQRSPGGYVMNSQPGLYDNVLVLDFKSLYPSIIRTFGIDPLGMAQPGDDPIPGYLGASFARGESILTGIITRLWTARDRAKRDGNRAMSQVVKILMNSFYGVLGSPGCRFYDPKLASSITRRGHWIITRSRDWLEAAGFQVIYGDTDSLFVLLGPGPEPAQAEAGGRELAQRLNHWWQEVIANEFQLTSYLEVEFETHFLRFLMPTVRGAETGSKKRYAGTVRDTHGTEQLLFKGLESVRSDWTPLARQFQRALYRRVFAGEPYRDYLKQLVSHQQHLT
jgi:DNA polymerase-2